MANKPPQRVRERIIVLRYRRLTCHEIGQREKGIVTFSSPPPIFAGKIVQSFPWMYFNSLQMQFPLLRRT